MSAQRLDWHTRTPCGIRALAAAAAAAAAAAVALLPASRAASCVARSVARTIGDAGLGLDQIITASSFAAASTLGGLPSSSSLAATAAAPACIAALRPGDTDSYSWLIVELSATRAGLSMLAGSRIIEPMASAPSRTSEATAREAAVPSEARWAAAAMSE